MDITTEVATLALTNTLDPDLAARMADHLNTRATGVVPKVSFPSAWVLAKQKGLVEMAVYAITYCEDPATLALIERSARRVGVRHALAANPHLSVATVQHMLEWDKQHHNWGVVGALTLRELDRTRPTADQALSTLLESPITSEQKSDLLRLLGSLVPDERAVWAERLLTKVISERPAPLWLVEHLLRLRYHSRSYDSCKLGEDPVVWNAPRLLDALDPESRKSLLRALLTSMLRRSSQTEPYGADVASYFIKFVDPAAFISSSYSQSAEWFDEAGVSLLVADPKWNHIMAHHVMTDEQYFTYLANTPPKLYPKLLSERSLSRPRVKAIVDLLPQDTMLEDPKQALAIRQVCADEHDELLTWLVAHLQGDALTMYVRGDWAAGSVPAIPDIRQVSNLLAHPSLENVNQGEVLYVALRNQRLPTEYLKALVDVIPGAFIQALAYPEMSQYIYERLSTCNVSIELALEQLSTNPKVPLGILVTRLSAFSRALSK
jgi:hypothetical protein